MDRKTVVRDQKGQVVEVITEALPAFRDTETGEEVRLDEIGAWFVTSPSRRVDPRLFKGLRGFASLSDARAYAQDLMASGVYEMAITGVRKASAASVEPEPADAVAGKALRKPTPAPFGFQGTSPKGSPKTA